MVLRFRGFHQSRFYSSSISVKKSKKGSITMFVANKGIHFVVNFSVGGGGGWKGGSGPMCYSM